MMCGDGVRVQCLGRWLRGDNHDTTHLLMPTRPVGVKKGDSDGCLLRSGIVQPSGDDAFAGGAALVRSRLALVLRLQPRGIRALLSPGRRTRSPLRDGALGDRV